MSAKKVTPEIQINKFTEICSTIRAGFRCAALCTIFYITISGLKEIVLSSPAGISALAKVVEAFRLGTVSAYMMAGGLGVAWAAERNGKKRAIREKSKYQKMLEQKDPQRSSSGLTETGETPED